MNKREILAAADRYCLSGSANRENCISYIKRTYARRDAVGRLSVRDCEEIDRALEGWAPADSDKRNTEAEMWACGGIRLR